MKRYSTGILLFAVLTIVVVSHQMFRTAAPSVEAASTVEVSNPTDTPKTDIQTATDAGQMVNTSSDYTLPYPGILPSHPLYFLKKLRDRIIEMLIVDPERKSEFYLLQSDKWIASVPLLIAKGDIPTAQTILDESSDRMALSVAELTSMKGNSRSVPSGTIDRLQKAIEKHLEIVDELSVDKKVDTVKSRDAYVKAQDALMKVK